MTANSFLVCLASPVLHKMLCGRFREGMKVSSATEKNIELDLADVDQRAFTIALGLCFGRTDLQELELGEAEEVAKVADQYELTVTTSVLEEALIEQLSVDMCGPVIMWSGRFGMRQLEAVAQRMAAEQFEQFAGTEGFMRMEEEELIKVLDDDRLPARKEEDVWEAVVGWLRVHTGGFGVARMIRFPLMEEGYLRNRVAGMVDREWMEHMVAEALRAQAARREGAVMECELLGRKALVDRVRPGVQWGDYREGGKLCTCLETHHETVMAIVECGGRICSACKDGVILVWDQKSIIGGPQFQLSSNWDDGDPDFVEALAVWEDLLISAHGSGKLRMWNVATGLCIQVVEGDLDEEVSGFGVLAVCGSRLLSASESSPIKVWAMARGSAWSTDVVLTGHNSNVCSLAVFGSLVIGGLGNGIIDVWNLDDGKPDSTLVGHLGAVNALVVHGDQLLSASNDGTIRVWGVGRPWLWQRTVDAYDKEGMGMYPCCLAVSGSRLVCASSCIFDHEEDTPQSEVRVWGLAELDLRQTLPLLDGRIGVVGLLAVEDEVWGGYGCDLLVWGHHEEGAEPRRSGRSGGGGAGGAETSGASHIAEVNNATA